MAKQNGGKAWIRWIFTDRRTLCTLISRAPFPGTTRFIRPLPTSSCGVWMTPSPEYHPDVIYFDEHAGDSQVDLGVHMGLGFLAPLLAANFYNKSLQWNHGKMDAVLNLKGVGGRYNSFQDHPELLPFVDRSLVKSTEAIIEPQIMAYPFQTETTSGTWHYKNGQHYMDARTVIKSLMENVSRNGTLLLNISQHGRGNLDPEAIRICKDVGAWLKVNGEAVYGSRPFEVPEENGNAVCYTRNDGNVYATLLNWNGGPSHSSLCMPAGRRWAKCPKSNCSAPMFRSRLFRMIKV